MMTLLQLLLSSRLLLPSRRDRRRDGDDARELWWWWGHLCLSVDGETEECCAGILFVLEKKVKSFEFFLSILIVINCFCVLK